MGGFVGYGYKYLLCYVFGYFCCVVLCNVVSVVMVVCFVICMSIYCEVNGFDEGFVVVFNDVDFCLCVCEVGYCNVWMLFVELYYYEFVLCGYEDMLEKMECFVKEIDFVKNCWGDVFWNDLFYLLNFFIDLMEFVIMMSLCFVNVE